MYGGFTLVLATINSLTSNAMGINDPHYKQLAALFSEINFKKEKIYTNSFHVLDVHQKIYSEFTDTPSKLKQGDLFFWVTLPNYDAGNSSVVTVDISNVSWQELDTFEGGKLLRKK